MPYSTFSKIHDVILTLQELKTPIEIDELAQRIQEDTSKQSFYVWISGDNGSVKTRCKVTSIQKQIVFSGTLGLVNINNIHMCQLSSIGQFALQRDNYAGQLAAQVKNYIRNELSLRFDQLEEAIKSLKSEPVPDFDALKEAVKRKFNVNPPDAEFRRALYLLERCEVVNAEMRKVYQVAS